MEHVKSLEGMTHIA